MMLIPLFVFLLGICIGSFLNVVIYRFNTGLSIAKGRSRCGSCSKTLEWYELVPLLSFIIQRGACRACKTKLSPQYLLVELLTGLVFLSIFLRFPTDVASFLYFTTLWCILIVICVYDLRHKIIPDTFAFLFALLSLAGSFMMYPHLSTFLAGPIVALPLFLIWLISRGNWMGFGDVKLALGIGWFLGASSGLAALTLGFWVGAAIGIVLLVLPRNKVTMKSEIPFAPFLIIGIAIVFWKGIGLTDLLNLFNFIQ